MLVPTDGRDLNLDDNDSTDDPFTFENWKLWVGDVFKDYHVDYFNHIASSEYLSQNFFKFPTYLRREISHRTIQDMPIESLEAYVRLRQSLPDNRKPTFAVSDDYFKKLRISGKKNGKRSETESFLTEIAAFSRFQDSRHEQNVYAYNKIVAIALIQKYGERLMSIAMREWQERSTQTDIHLFVGFVKTLAESEHPIEWTAAVVL